MDKTVLKNFAIYARNKLIQEIKNKASMIGITEKGIQPPLPESTEDMLVFDIKAVETYKIYDEEVKQYEKLIEELNKREDNSDYNTAYNTLIEEVAYTWFNRLIAIRFMEVNNYLPDKMRVLSSGREGVNEPEFVTYYQDTNLNFTNRELEKLSIWKIDGSATAMEKMFHLLFIKQCNALNENLPELFEKTDDYAELLLTISYNDPDGVLYKLVHDVPEEYFDVESEKGNGQVEIIGWMYQYYNTERKDEVINIVGKNKVKKQDIPAATQLFTTDWVVRYMVDNSLGKYWLERNPDSSIKDSLEYLMPGEITVIDEKISPEDLKVFDNAMGSGHCLSYAFDVLLMIYESEGYTAREASKLIVEKNLYGLDIDKRAYQLAYFAIMMKARQYNRRVLNGELKTNLEVFEDSTSINKSHLEYLGLSMNTEKRKKALEQINYLIKEFENATEIGSILRLENIDKNLILEFINDSATKGQIMIGEINIDKTKEKLQNLVQVANMLTQRYDIMVTNPPYLNKFDVELKKYINNNYKEYKGDMFSVFIYHNLQLCKSNGYSAYMTPNVWMFIKSYERLREWLISQKHIDSLVQIAKGSFYKEATVDVITFVIKNCKSENKGKFIRLEDFKGDMEVQRVKTLEAIQNPQCGYYYETEQDNFEKIPGMPIAYWASSNLIEAFKNGKPMNSIIDPKQGLATADNNRFLRLWHEVDINKISFNSNSIESSIESKAKWFPYNKGGARRQWYGNYDYVVNWENDGFEIRNFKDNNGKLRSRPQNTSYYFKEAITWSLITSGGFSIRYREVGSIHDVAGMSAFSNNHDKLMYILGLMSTKISNFIFKMLNPTINLQIGDFNNFPVLFSEDEQIIKLVEENISIAKQEWNSYEEAWEFKKHPFLMKGEISTLKEAFDLWKEECKKRIEKTKSIEEELNRIFIKLYKLENELSSDVNIEDITLRNANLTKDIKSFISYAVGCMFGRYSLDIEGLAYAGGEFEEKLRMESEEWKIKSGDNWVKSSIDIARDNIILITDEEYFEDDIVNRFINFVKVCYGEETLEENLEFIAEALGEKGTPKEIIKNYFIKDFYKDHVKTYQKRPIYWLYDSGKQNGFKALIYMHRYNEDTTGKLRIDYLHKMQKAYERAMDNLKYDIANNKNPREVAASEKHLAKITKQLKECKDYDEKIGHLALARIPIDLDDGVKVNYDKIQTDEKGKNLKILAKIK